MWEGETGLSLYASSSAKCTVLTRICMIKITKLKILNAPYFTSLLSATAHTPLSFEISLKAIKTPHKLIAKSEGAMEIDFSTVADSPLDVD